MMSLACASRLKSGHWAISFDMYMSHPPEAALFLFPGGCDGPFLLIFVISVGLLFVGMGC